ncbi:HMG box protein [Phlyctema vagabunda]|uniref:HMG box protein n=1 Tax=Phlyctema vagabunda TaxID=108571 RepID=A0ABR4PFU7_9HELO
MTPFTPAFGSIDSRNDRLLPPFTPGAPSHIEEMSRFPAQGMDSPHNGVGPPQAHRRGLYPPPQPLHTLREREEDLNMSPDQKRRRFNDGPQRAYPSPSSVSYSGPQTFPRNGPSMPPSVYRGPQQFPGQGSFSRSTAMAPPQQSPLFQQQPRHPYPTRANTFDESLRLPPLQTQLATPVSVSTARLELRPESRESQARSVEAMVMTIPYLNKIKVLSKISGPLRTPGPTSPSHDIRGAIIAVEGADSSLVSEVGAFLNEALSKEPSLAIKTWTAPPTSTSNPITPSTDTEMADEERKEVADDSDHDPFIDYLTTISKWHKKSEAIQKHITSTPAAPPIDPGVTKRSSDSAQKRLPVALLPEGFSITTSDHFALRIPINDAYAPVDHWQWMATLWRGIVGPDLTVYVKKIRDKDEFESMSGVELRKDCAAIVVRVMDGTKLDEKSARRLAFEVSEYVRGVEGSFGRA